MQRVLKNMIEARNFLAYGSRETARGVRIDGLAKRFIFAAIVLMLDATTAAAQLVTYDLDALGVPQLVNTNYMDLKSITSVSKFRSNVGHDFSDSAETCRSMKHFLSAPDPTVKIYAPFAGTVSRFDNDPTEPGKTVYITSDVQPAFVISIFHMIPEASLAIGDRVNEGQVIGVHRDTQHVSDVAVSVNTTKGIRLVSYFELLTDKAFAEFQARGATSRSQFIISKEVRDADPYQCSGTAFINLQNSPSAGNVQLSSRGLQQTLAVSGLAEYSRLGDSPITIAATTNSGLYLTTIALTPAVCTVSGASVSFVAAGFCLLSFNQGGNADYAPLSTTRSTTVYADLYAGPISSAAQTGSQSFLRFFNTGASAGTVVVRLYNQLTGQALAQWSSPSIPAGAAAQYAIGDIESGAVPSFTRSNFYAITVQAGISGTFQHVLWHTSNGTLSNLTTCAVGATAHPGKLNNVHASILDNGYPSSVVVNNAGVAAQTVTLGVYDAGTGNKLGTYSAGPISAGGHIILPIKTIETGAGVTPISTRYHYVIQAEGAFNGFLQHLVNNQQAGVVTDMTTVCALNGASASANGSPFRLGAVHSTTQQESQSFVRFYNPGAAAGTATVMLYDHVTGKSLGQWTSPSIAAGAQSQFSIGAIETAIGNATKPTYYSLTAFASFQGSVRHVVWRPAAGTLTNLTTCGNGATSDPTRLAGVHSSLLNEGYPSSVVVSNTSNTQASVTLGVYNANDGAKLGTYATAMIPANAQAILAVSEIEAGMGKEPAAGVFHYVIKAESLLTGFLQHRVNNTKVGVVTDLTTACAL
jgi:hypothetical protein